MLISILGANGQVATEVCLLLANQPQVEVRPIVRTKGGSAFLRLNGMTVSHGDISSDEEASRLLSGSGVIANFALASGSPRQALQKNAAIIKNIFKFAPRASTIVFISTIAVHGEFDTDGQRRNSFYGRLKRKNERQVLALSRAFEHRAYVLRLGHVTGDLQNITALMRREIGEEAVHLPFPDLEANISSTATIVDALLAIASGNLGPPGLYDVINQPQWTWRQAYEHEARMIGQPLALQSLMSSTKPKQKQSLLRGLISILNRPKPRELVLKALGAAPNSFAAKLKAANATARARAEIAALDSSVQPSTAALVAPAHAPRYPPGLRNTQDVLKDPRFRLDQGVWKTWSS